MLDSLFQLLSDSDKIYHKEYNVDEVKLVASEISQLIDDSRIILFVGDLGAGKTTLIKSLMKIWNVEEAVTSPTFAIVNEYETTDNQVIYHMDLYRLNNLEEAIEIGIEDMIASGERCIIEWPEYAMPFLNKRFAIINIEHLTIDSRSISLLIRS